MRANALMKANINALLRARHQTRHDLAQWCRRSDAWIAKIMAEERREFPMKYWDRIADFFGIATFQLLQPGLSPYYERRKAERRGGKDRRVSAMNHQVRESVSSLVANLNPADVGDLLRLRALSDESRQALRTQIETLARSETRVDGRTRRRRGAGNQEGGATDATTHGAERRTEQR